MARKKTVPPVEGPEVKEASPETIPAPEPETTPETAPAYPAGRPGLVTAPNGLNVREGPGFGFRVLDTAACGTLLPLLDLPLGVTVPGWELVDTGKCRGWVSSRHLRVVGA